MHLTVREMHLSEGEPLYLGHSSSFGGNHLSIWEMHISLGEIHLPVQESFSPVGGRETNFL